MFTLFWGSPTIALSLTSQACRQQILSASSVIKIDEVIIKIHRETILNLFKWLGQQIL